MNIHTILSQTERQRVSDGAVLPILSGCKSPTKQLVLLFSPQQEQELELCCKSPTKQLVLLLPQLGDFDSLEYAWWLRRDAQRLEAQGIAIRAVGIGDRSSGQRLCSYTTFPKSCYSSMILEKWY